MNIFDFVSGFRNHPVLFIGTGVSLRYLENSYTWDSLLKFICYEYSGNNEHYLDIKSNHYNHSKYDYTKIASDIELEFNSFLQKPEQRNGKFKEINDVFYKNMENGINNSRFKIFISELFKTLNYNPEKQDELQALKRVRKNIGSVITTNYDRFVEDVFEFAPLVGNGILLSNPYGSVYKIHGCVTEPDKIIITSDDYTHFSERYELIRAQLLSLFIHNPIIFIGYNIGDDNIKSILKTIFTYVDPNTEEANKIRSNFLLIEYDHNSANTEVIEHDIVLDDIATIRINKIKTDDYTTIYNAISGLQLPVSAMDIRKVQNIVREIYTGGSVKVSITEDLDQLDNKDKVLVIGSKKTIKYAYQTIKEMMINYFAIIEEDNAALIELINKQTIQNQQFFPVYGFSNITTNIENEEQLKQQQQDKLSQFITSPKVSYINQHTTVEEIEKDDDISKTNKDYAIIYGLLNNQIELCSVEHLLRNHANKSSTEYRRLLCAYDYMKYK